MKYKLDADPRIKLADLKEGGAVFPVYVQFIGDFSEASAAKFRTDLANAENAAIQSQQEVIPIIIDSYGGEVHALLSMVDAIRACSVPVATIVEGKAMSCGAILFTCGAEGHRYVGHNASVMMHDVSSVAWGKVEDMRTSFHHSEQLKEVVLEIASVNCGHEPDYFLNFLEEHNNQDVFLNAKECVEHNMANHIGIPRFNIKISMDVSMELHEQNNRVIDVSTIEKVKVSKPKKKTKKEPSKKKKSKK